MTKEPNLISCPICDISVEHGFLCDHMWIKHIPRDTIHNDKPLTALLMGLFRIIDNLSYQIKQLELQ